MAPPSPRARRIVLAALFGVALLFIATTSQAQGHILRMSSPAPKNVPLRSCTFKDGNAFDCAPAFAPAFYRATYPDAARLSDAEAWDHFRRVGIPEGRRAHGGNKILKVVLMTKNEWPLLKAWVLYHAHLLGAHNLYILDASDQPEVLDFLRQVKTRLGVNVFRSTASLNEMEGEIHAVLHSVRFSCDYVAKVDTDEFIALTVPDRAAPGKLTYTPYGVQQYLNNLTWDGRRLKWGYYADGVSSKGCTPEDMPTDTVEYSRPQLSNLKILIPSWTYAGMDLGAHRGTVDPPYHAGGVVDTMLGMAHLHNACYESVVANNRKALLSHGYINADDSKEVQLEKCNGLTERAMKCRMPSCHKILDYLAHLKDPIAHRAAYESRTFNAETDMIFTGVRDVVQHLVTQWDGRADFAA